MFLLLRAALSLLASSLILTITTAQLTTTNYDFRDFDRVLVAGLNGNVRIHVGQPFGVRASVAAQDSALVSISHYEGSSTLELRYFSTVEDARCQPLEIDISLPTLSRVSNGSSADVAVTNYSGPSLRVENSGNGGFQLMGTTVDWLEIETSGNGDTRLEGITAAGVTIDKSGNGNLAVRTPNEFTVTIAGNGDVINYGTGKALVRKQTGNGRVIKGL